MFPILIIYAENKLANKEVYISFGYERSKKQVYHWYVGINSPLFGYNKIIATEIWITLQQHTQCEERRQREWQERKSEREKKIISKKTNVLAVTRRNHVLLKSIVLLFSISL